MHTTVRLFTLWTAFAIAPGSPVAAQEAPPVDLSELERTIVAELEATKTPGAAVAIVSGDRVVFARGFGVADVETGAPMTPDTLVPIASAAKMFTATLALTFVEEGRFKLDEPVGSYARDLAPRLGRVTGLQLLTHRAGLADAAADYGRLDDAGLGAYVRSLGDEAFFGEPGEVFSYSNPGFGVVGFVIETIGGRPFADLLAERVFAPLGMARSTSRLTVAVTRPFAQGHAPGAQGTPGVVRPFPGNVAHAPDGFMFTSASDLSRFAVALVNEGRVDGRQALAPSIVARLSEPHPGPADLGWGYGLGLWLRDLGGARSVEHGGSITGFGSYVRTVPERRFAVVVLTNRTGSTMPRTLAKATELFVPGYREAAPTPATAPVPVPAGEAAALAGVYRNGAVQSELVVKDGALVARFRGVDLPVMRTGAGRYAVRIPGASPIEIVAVSGPDGRVKYLFTGQRALRRVE